MKSARSPDATPGAAPRAAPRSPPLTIADPDSRPAVPTPPSTSRRADSTSVETSDRGLRPGPATCVAHASTSDGSSARWRSLKQRSELGSIEAGKLADHVVLDRPFLSIGDEEIKQIKPVLTMVGGRVAHARAPFGSLAE